MGREKNLQQISNTSLYSEDTRSGKIGAESPGSDLQASLCRCPNDLNPLVHSSDSQRRLVTLLASWKSIGVFASDVDVAAVDGAIMPLGLEDVVVRVQHAADDSEDDEEDASACVFSGSRGRPLAREEWCAVIIGEGHGQGMRHAAAVRRGGTHVHA